MDTELPRSLSVNFYPILKTIGGLITPEEGARGQIDVATVRPGEYGKICH